MKVTEAAPPGIRPPLEPKTRQSWGFLASPWVLVPAALGMLLVFGWTFLLHPTLSAPTRDPAWYTWRAELLAHAAPASVVREWGPFGMFSGGYRVTMPLTGAWLIRMGGMSRYTFSILVMVGLPTLASLALGAFAYRHRGDPLVFFMTFFASAALFLTIPYVGYMDNITCLYILALTLPFLRPARTSWGARSAIALLLFLATLTHPTTTAIFAGVLIAGAGLHFLTSRFSIRETLRADGWVLASAGAGAVAGLAMWKIGAWGVKAPFADAALPPPYPESVFRSQLGQWIFSLKPAITFPLMAVAVGSIVMTAMRRRGEPTDEYPRMSLLWMLPLLGMFGFVLGLSYPYYRFMNTTLAPLLLVGMGAWVVVRWFKARSAGLGVAAVAVILAGFGFILASGLGPWTSQAVYARFLDPGTRAALASVEAYAGTENGNRPIVFVTDYRDDRKAWGWSKTYANTARAGLGGDQALRSAVYFGSLDDYLAGRPSTATSPVYERVSRGFFRETERTLRAYPAAPMTFLLTRFNLNTPNAGRVDQFTRLGPNVALVTGPGLAPASPPAVRAATEAGDRTTEALADPPGLLSDPMHVLRGLVVLALFLLVPGLIAMRWFELEDFPSRLALVPGISFALTLFSAFVVVAVHRAPFGLADGIASVALACGIAVVLNVLARRRRAGKALVVPFVRRATTLFANRNFALLMGTVFLAVLGDGIVQGSLAKTIAFGGQAGFSLDEARSPQDILALVVLTYLPYTFISPFLGVLIDRFDRRLLLVAANGIRAAVVVLVAVAGLDRLPDAAIIGALLLTLASTRLVLAIKSAGMPSVLGERNLLQGNSISQAGQAVFQIVGAGIALVGTAVVSAGLVVIVGGIVYAIGALMAARVGSLEAERPLTRIGEEVRRILRTMLDGFREVRSRRAARIGVAAFLALRSLVTFSLLIFALEIRRILGGESNAKAALIAGAGGALGAVVGFVAAQNLRGKVAPARLLAAAFVVAGVGTGLFGAILGSVGLAGVAFASALGYFVGKIAADTIMQRALPDRFRGRGFSLFDVAYNLAWIVPAIVLYVVWSAGTARVLLVATGLAYLGCAALVAGASVRAADELPGPERAASDVSVSES